MLDVILCKKKFITLALVIVKIDLIQNRKILYEKPLLNTVAYQEITNRHGYFILNTSNVLC